MPLTDTLRDLDLLLRSRHGLILMDTEETDRADALLRHLADRQGVPLFRWSRLDGLSADGGAALYDTRSLDKALEHVVQARHPALYHFPNAGEDIARPETAARLERAAGWHARNPGAVVLSGEHASLPAPTARKATTFALPAPKAEEYRDLLGHIVRDLKATGPVEVDLDRAAFDRLLGALAGLTLMEAEKVLTRAIVEEGGLSEGAIRRVIDAKVSVVEREGLLEYYPAEESLAEIADLATLKEWLRQRQAVIASPERARSLNLPFPRGILLLGVPGCGKSLCARAVASEWSLPLLRFDPGRLYNRYVGESERNLRRALQAAERMAPVVLWIDEIEKAFSQSEEGDGGVSSRIFGTFLSWMQDRREPIFVVATANDVSRLPPEFLRKGRFDETFFVDLPDEGTRREILGIHLARRNRDPSGFDLAGLAGAAEGFSGAELEQAVVSAAYTALSSDGDLTSEAIREEIERTHPLSRTMAEEIARLRTWSEGRAVRAH
jgi:hypothetical protein